MIVVGKQCLNIRGRDVFIFSGAFHYARCPKPLWRDRLAKMRDADLNCIDYYIPWNYHEREQPTDVNDFSQVDVSEVEEFLKIVHDEFGFYSIARPGPYICAEWHGGGFPWWLLTRKPKHAAKPWLRSDDSTYLAWSRHWYDAICPVIAREQLTRKQPDQGGVILFQIENEYDFYAGVTDQQRVRHLKALANDARRNGIEVPLMTCWTRQCRSNPNPVLKDVFDGPNMYPRWNMAAVEERLVAVKQQQPNAPGMVPELQGGWFCGVGGALSEDQPDIDTSQIHHITLMAMMNDATILNYYMFFGGTNFDTWAGRKVATSYDYNAPIREPGGVGDRFLAVKAIGEMLKIHGEAIAGSVRTDAKLDALPDGVSAAVREARNGDIFVFVRSDTLEARTGHIGLTRRDLSVLDIPFDLPRRGFKVLHLPAPSPCTQGEGGREGSCETTNDASSGYPAPLPGPLPEYREREAGWWPQPVERLCRPPVPADIRIATAKRRVEPLTGEWIDVADDTSLPACGIYDARYVAYRAKMVLTESQLTQFDSLWLDLYQDDHVALQLNGRLIFPSGNYRGGPAYEIRKALRTGENEFILLYENRGYIHFGGGLESLCGIRSVMLTSSDRLSLPVFEWKAKLLEEMSESDVAQESFDDSRWPTFTLDPVMADRLASDLQPGTETEADFTARILFRKKTKAVYRSTFDIAEADLVAGKTRLVTRNIDHPSAIYVNGQLLLNTEARPTALSLDLSGVLRAGRNTLVFVLENVVGFQAGLMTPFYLEGKEIAGQNLRLQLLSDLAGVKRRWHLPDHPARDWELHPLDTTLALSKRGHLETAPLSTPDHPAVWYRVEFELPEQSNKTWIPRRALIDASGNGLVSLNEHCIGRYWEAGPQREYYLPECWLNFGQGGRNVLTLCLRSTSRGAFLRAVEIRPYEDQAEFR